MKVSSFIRPDDAFLVSKIAELHENDESLSSIFSHNRSLSKKQKPKKGETDSEDISEDE